MRVDAENGSSGIAAAAAAAVASGHANRFVPSLSFSSLRIYLYQPSSLSLALYERACEGQGTWGFSFPLSSRARALFYFTAVV